LPSLGMLRETSGISGSAYPFMFSLAKSVHFLINHQLREYIPGLQKKSIDLACNGVNLTNTFRPKNVDISARPTVIVIHGMSPQGIEDVRILRWCQSLAKLGYLVVAPEYKLLRDCGISIQTAVDIQSTFEVIAADKDLCPSGKLAVMGVSFGASLSLIAASRMDRPERFAAMCLVGGYYDLRDSLHYMINNSSADPYGLTIFLKNFTHLLFDEPELAKEILSISIEDLSYVREEPLAEKEILRLCKLDQDRLGKYLSNQPFRAKWFQEIEDHLDELFNQHALTDILGRVDFPITMIHGEDDTVIPPSQSLQMYQELNRHSRRHHVLITPLISHADASIGLKDSLHIQRMIFALGHFFRSADRQ